MLVLKLNIELFLLIKKQTNTMIEQTRTSPKIPLNLK